MSNANLGQTVTYEDALEQLGNLRTQFDTIEPLVDPEATAARVTDLENEMNADGFWNDQGNAAKVGAEHTRQKRKLENFRTLQGELDDIATLLEMARESDLEERQELLAELAETLPPLTEKLGRLQEESLFTGDYDANAAIVSINSGEGGVDAQDWAEMLLRMYSRFLERRGLKVEVNAISPGEEAGIKSASFTVTGDYAYGIMNAEAGVHRLVRLSPFDSAHRRQTSFASVETYPLFDDLDSAELEVDEKDLRVDTYRASGAGGQHVNKTESAVRITHVPTGTVAQCQNERSQMQNRETAMKMLKAKLFELERQKREALISSEKGEAQNVGFGSQIRSYVLQPYQMVKDLRTRWETGNVSAVLVGDIDELILAYLLHRAQGGGTFRADATADLD
jgi:peptide chain release factor 2